MNLSEPFIRRPVATTMLTAALLLFGMIAFKQLPISDLPSIAFPVITVSATNPGMDPESMANNVATPIEQQLMAIPGIRQVISTSRLGYTSIAVVFDLDKDIDEASTDVNSAINNASGNLPPELPSPPSYKKVNPADAPVIYLAVSSETTTLGKLYDYGYTIIAQRLSMLEGVSQVSVFGSKSNVRVKVNPDKLAAMNIGINDVAQSIVNANQNLPTGTFYDSKMAYTITTNGQLKSGEAYDDVIITERNGKPVYVKDIGRGTDSVHDEGIYIRYWDREKGEIPSVIVAVTKESGSNTVQLCNTIREFLSTLEKDLPPSISLSVAFDRSLMIKSSINDVLFTLFLAFVLVVLVIFLFLGKARPTIIPSISLPVSIFGTFVMMYVNNYSVDILSMLGLTLVVGFLVDDAIVVLENIVRHQDMGKTPLQAALDGSKQISTTVLSMTLALSTVFLPLVFMPGIVGRLFHEMAMVVVISVLISGGISLILTPTLCSKFLKHSPQKSWLETRADQLMEKLLKWYEPALKWVLRNRKIPIMAGAGIFVLAGVLFKLIPMDFLPPGDTGAMLGLTIAGEDVSYDAMSHRQEEVNKVLKENPYINNIISVANFPEVFSSNQGLIFTGLIDINKRPPIETVSEQVEKELRNIPGINAYLRPIPQINMNVSTGVQRADYSYIISGIEDSRTMYEKAQELADQMKQSGEFTDVSTDVENSSPHLNINIIRDRASILGVTVKAIEQAIQFSYSGSRISTYQTPLNIYDVVMQVEDGYRNNPSALEKIRLSSSNIQNKDKLIPLKSVTQWEEINGPLVMNHTNQLSSATVYFNVAPGVALSEGLQKVTELADAIFPLQYFRTFSGQAQMFQGTMGQIGVLLLIGVIIIYMLLASLYENFYHPLTILTTLPGAVFGGLLTLFIFRSTLSLYAFVGIIVLIGIVLKNGIMLVEFANELVLEGKEVTEAIVKACIVRFRPILMTTVAAAMGAVPIAIGIGQDASTRRSMGLIILGGLIFAQFITYFFTPVICYYSMRSQKQANPDESPIVF